MGWQKIGIFDSDVFRRGAMSRKVFDSGYHCEPYEDLAEFARQVSTVDLVIAFDDLAAVSKIHETLHAADLWVPVVIYGVHPSARRVVDTLHEGAIDYLDWPADLEEVGTCLERLLGERSNYATMLAMAAKSRWITRNLSLREKQVLTLLKSGQSNKEMGHTLGLSRRTVEIHRANMLSKLQVANTAEAVSVAVYAELSDALPEVAKDVATKR